MASVFKRASDAARGKAGKWTIAWAGEDGRRRTRAGTTDKAESLRIANKLEQDAALVREGLLDPAEKARRQASLRAPADHAADYRLDLLARGGTAKHADRTRNALVRLLADAGVSRVSDLAPDRIRAALGRLKAGGLSARTCNFYLVVLKAFAAWMAHSNRIDEVPRGLAALKPYNQDEDRRLVRRALTREELDRLIAAAEAGGPIEATRGPRARTVAEKGAPALISGPERAALYRLAMGTGFRAEELRTLTPERFALDGDDPTITVLATYAKNGKEARQPITRELAAQLRPFVARSEPGKPVLNVPVRAAKMLRHDLAKADIPYKDKSGRVVDFHALRGSYITHLVMAGVNPKIVQMLARHSDLKLTLGVYTHVENADLRKAIEGEE